MSSPDLGAAEDEVKQPKNYQSNKDFIKPKGQVALLKIERVDQTHNTESKSKQGDLLKVPSGS